MDKFTDIAELQDMELEDIAFAYAMDALSPEVRRTVRSEKNRDETLQGLIQKWQQLLPNLDHTLTPQTPPAQVWDAVQKNIRVKKVKPQKGLARIWGWYAGAASFATVCLIALTLLWNSPAQINLDNQWEVTAKMDNGTIVMAALTPDPMPADKVCNLWIKGEGKVMKVGMLPMKGTTTMQLDSDLQAMFSQKAVLIVTVDKKGSQPTQPNNVIVERTWL